MRVLFRADASVHIGTGHIMRCLTLADALRERGAECQFVCREHEGHLIENILKRNFYVHRLPLVKNFVEPNNSIFKHEPSHIAWLGSDWTTDAEKTKDCTNGSVVDWVIVDHYALDIKWEKSIRQICQGLMVIDDLADRLHDCDILLDQNFYLNKEWRYQGLLPKHCKTLLGSDFFLLSTEFEKARMGLRKRDGTVNHIAVFFGGSDSNNQTQIVLAALKKLNMSGISVDVIVGPINQNRDVIKLICDQMPGVSYHCNISNMSELIIKADLGIGAGGYAMWERCYLGLPTITVVVAEHQVSVTKDVAELGAIEYLGSSDSLGVDDYARAISTFISNPLRLKNISAVALAMMNKSTTTMVVDELLNFLNKPPSVIAHSVT
jgi:UDP-2,4-diacetamido-2,4,6-trideoxy-beta-L-altropyranose hydrolase